MYVLCLYSLEHLPLLSINSTKPTAVVAGLRPTYLESFTQFTSLLPQITFLPTEHQLHSLLCIFHNITLKRTEFSCQTRTASTQSKMGSKSSLLIFFSFIYLASALVHPLTSRDEKLKVSVFEDDRCGNTTHHNGNPTKVYFLSLLKEPEVQAFEKDVNGVKTPFKALSFVIDRLMMGVEKLEWRDEGCNETLKTMYSLLHMKSWYSNHHACHYFPPGMEPMVRSFLSSDYDKMTDLCLCSVCCCKQQ